MAHRVRSGLAIGAVVSTAAVLGGWAWAALCVLFFPLAYRELLRLMHAKQIAPSRLMVIVLSVLFYAFACFGLQRHFDVLVTMGIIATFSWLLFRPNPASICDIGGTILMFFYLGFLPAHFILLRQLGASSAVPFWQTLGLKYLFIVLFTVSAADIAAYYGGKRFGKNLLSPKISPKKTIEGSIVGLVAGMLLAGLAAAVFQVSIVSALGLGAITVLVAQAGDLSESLLKRDAGLKDSGSLIPGHGGLLDRTDSYIFAGAVAYYYVLWVVLHQGVAKDVLNWVMQYT